MIDPKMLVFFTELKDNNTKDWFNERKTEYKKMHEAFSEQLKDVAVEVARFDSEVQRRLDDAATVKVHRIYNDTRFAKAADPLKTDISGVISAGKDTPMYYLRVTPNESMAGGGMYSPSNDVLAAIREELGETYKELDAVVSAESFKAAFPEGLDESMAVKTAPRGYSSDHPAIHYLRLKSFAAIRTFTADEVTRPDFKGRLVSLYEAQHGLNRYLYKAMRHLPGA